MALLGLDEFFPIVVEGMKKNMKTHWSNTMWQHRKHYARTVLELQNENPQLTKEEVQRKETWETIQFNKGLNFIETLTSGMYIYFIQMRKQMNNVQVISGYYLETIEAEHLGSA